MANLAGAAGERVGIAGGCRVAEAGVQGVLEHHLHGHPSPPAPGSPVHRLDDLPAPGRAAPSAPGVLS